MKLTTIRRTAVGIAAAAAVSTAAAGAAQAFLPDPVRLTDNKIDFGDSSFVFGAPIGTGAVWWSILDGFYTPHLVGTLHLNNAEGMSARMHIDYYDGAGGLIDTNHGGTVDVANNDNSHHSWSVDLWPDDLRQIVSVRVCTELSNDGSSFWQEDCTGRLYM